MARINTPLAGPALPATQPTAPPTDEIGAQTQQSIVPAWSHFIDEAEYAPELTFPTSILTYHRMRSDTQIEALHLGTVQPVREMRWMIDPNGADAKLVESVAADMNLPIKGTADDATVARSRNKFEFDDFLSDALLGPLYGFIDFEIAGTNSPDDGFRMSKLAPRHPRTIADVMPDEAGDLYAIRQRFGKAGAVGLPEPIMAAYLIHLTWRGEAGTLTGRSMLRSMYREWLIKDRVIRVAAINLERAGGVPVVYGAQGASQKQIEELAELARQFKVAEGGGGALPFGTKLELAGGSVPDAIALLKYCDEAMARVWALMLLQLGATQTGSRALGGEFATYAARAQRLMAKWVATGVNDFFDRYTEWTDPFATHAPLLVYEASRPEGVSVTDLVSLLDAGALTVDEELEEWLRSEYQLPKKPPPVVDPNLGELSDDEVALVQNARNPQAPGERPKPNPEEVSTPKPSKALDPTATYPTLASGTLELPRVHNGVRASLTLPDRVLRRPPSENEIRAAVDFRGLDSAHTKTTADLHALYLDEVLPQQIKALGDQVRSGVAARDLQAPLPTVEQMQTLSDRLHSAMAVGARSAVSEARAQGVTGIKDTTIAPGALAKAVEQAGHVAQLNANGLSLGAQRHAGRLLAGHTPEDAAMALEAKLTGQKHVYERENLKGAVTQAQNAGRIEAMEQIAPEVGTATYEASELLDEATCDPCEAIDGTVYESIEDAEADYASGGYVDCDGGPNCRGTLVAIYPEQNPESDQSNPLSEPDEAFTQPEPGRELAEDEVTEPPAEAPATAPAAEPTDGESLLAKAQDVETHADAVDFLRNDLGIGEVDLGDKLARAAEGNYKPGSQGEMNQQAARTVLKGIVESIAEARDTFGADATHIDAVFTTSGAKRSGVSPAAREGIGGAHAAVRTLTNRITRESFTHLVVNDSLSFADMASDNLHETSGGFVSKATTDLRGRIMHEMGHVLEDNLPGFTMHLPKMLADSGLASTAMQRGVARFVSTYATTKPVETWAESFATLMRPGGVAEDFSYKGDTSNLQIARMTADADAKTKAALVKLRELWNAWATATYPNLPHIPER